MLGVYTPVIISVCRNPKKYPQEALQTAAVLALCKYMCASREFCDDNLQLMFTVRCLEYCTPTRSFGRCDAWSSWNSCVHAGITSLTAYLLPSRLCSVTLCM